MLIKSPTYNWENWKIILHEEIQISWCERLFQSWGGNAQNYNWTCSKMQLCHRRLLQVKLCPPQLTGHCRNKSVEGQRIEVHRSFITILQLFTNIIPVR